jgi:hypothetical protein
MDFQDVVFMDEHTNGLQQQKHDEISWKRRLVEIFLDEKVS